MGYFALAQLSIFCFVKMQCLHAAACTSSLLAIIAAGEWPEIRTPVQFAVMGLIVNEDEHAGRCY